MSVLPDDAARDASGSTHVAARRVPRSPRTPRPSARCRPCRRRRGPATRARIVHPAARPRPASRQSSTRCLERLQRGERRRPDVPAGRPLPGTMFGLSPPSVKMPWMRSSGGCAGAARRRSCSRARRRRARCGPCAGRRRRARPGRGTSPSAAGWRCSPCRTRSAPAGCTIIAASTPSNAPRRASSTLPPPPSSAGVPSTTTRPPSSRGRARRAASPAPRPAVPMMLCPQAWPMPGRASYSHSTAIVGPPSPASRLERGVEVVGATAGGRARASQRVGQQIVGEVLLEGQLGMGVDLVGDIEQHVGPLVDLGAQSASFRASRVGGSHGRTLGVAARVPEDDLAELLALLEAVERRGVVGRGRPPASTCTGRPCSTSGGDLGELLVRAHRRADDLELLEEEPRHVELDLRARSCRRTPPCVRRPSGRGRTAPTSPARRSRPRRRPGPATSRRRSRTRPPHPVRRPAAASPR